MDSLSEVSHHPTITEIFSQLSSDNTPYQESTSANTNTIAITNTNTNITANIANTTSSNNKTMSDNQALFVVYQDKSYRISDQRISIGRVATADLRIADVQVSTRHCVIDHGVLHDTRSTNGTFVNLAKVEPDTPLILKEGDVILIGSSELRVKSQPTQPVQSVQPVQLPGHLMQQQSSQQQQQLPPINNRMAMKLGAGGAGNKMFAKYNNFNALGNGVGAGSTTNVGSDSVGSTGGIHDLSINNPFVAQNNTSGSTHGGDRPLGLSPDQVLSGGVFNRQAYNPAPLSADDILKSEDPAALISTLIQDLAMSRRRENVTSRKKVTDFQRELLEPSLKARNEIEALKAIIYYGVDIEEVKKIASHIMTTSKPMEEINANANTNTNTTDKKNDTEDSLYGDVPVDKRHLSQAEIEYAKVEQAQEQQDKIVVLICSLLSELEQLRKDASERQKQIDTLETYTDGFGGSDTIVTPVSNSTTNTLSTKRGYQKYKPQFAINSVTINGDTSAATEKESEFALEREKFENEKKEFLRQQQEFEEMKKQFMSEKEDFEKDKVEYETNKLSSSSSSSPIPVVLATPAVDSNVGVDADVDVNVEAAIADADVEAEADADVDVNVDTTTQGSLFTEEAKSNDKKSKVMTTQQQSVIFQKLEDLVSKEGVSNAKIIAEFQRLRDEFTVKLDGFAVLEQKVQVLEDELEKSQLVHIICMFYILLNLR